MSANAATKESAAITKQIDYLARTLKAPRIREAAARLGDQARDAGWTHEECVFVLNGIALFELLTRTHPSGQPERDPLTHHYEVINHGSITIVSKSVYESLVLKYSRLLLGWPALFVAVALPVIVNEAVRVRRLRTTTTRIAPRIRAKNRRT